MKKLKLKKSETNNVIVTTLANVRVHPNADRLLLATVLGTQVIVGLEAKNGDRCLYFDANLALSYEFLHWNHLYFDSQLNADTTRKGYFGKNGRVRAQRFRGEVSNGFAVPMDSLFFIGVPAAEELKVGTEFTHINGIEICKKHLVEHSGGQGSDGKKKKKKKKSRLSTNMFCKHFDTHQLMREAYRLRPGQLFIEEKIHGTSGRTAHALYHLKRKWWHIWKPRITSFWKVVSGTRRKNSILGHMKIERQYIHDMLAPHVHKGEALFYEIYGYEHTGKSVQKPYPYDCVYQGKSDDWRCSLPLPFKVVLYRVIITTEDGYRVDLGRDEVYRRAEELGLEKPTLLHILDMQDDADLEFCCNEIMEYAQGNSALHAGTLREGVVVWFKGATGLWFCLKHKSEEFLLRESKQRDKGIGDIEDVL